MYGAPRSSGLLPAATLAELERLVLALGRLPGALGVEGGKGRPAGFGMEFHEYAAYQPGDDVRRVDWRRYERNGDLQVRTDVDRSGHPVHILLDRSASMGLGDPPKIDYARRLAAALSFCALQAGHPVGLVAFAGADGDVLSARSGIQWMGPLLTFLEGLRAGGATSLREGLNAALAGRRGRGRIVLISDLLDPAGPTAGLDALAGPRRAVDVVEVVASGERSLPVGDTVDALDAETGQVRTFTVDAEVQGAWREGLARLRTEVARGCADRGFTHVQAASEGRPIEVVRSLASIAAR